ncbi:MAG: hypothetical protein ACI3XR_00015 [Eubacteriales bacterium]
MKIRKILDGILSLIPHINIILSLFLITCFIVDRFNRAMAFINNDFTKITLLVLAILAIVQSVYLIVKHRRDSRDSSDQNGEEHQK